MDSVKDFQSIVYARQDALGSAAEAAGQVEAAGPAYERAVALDPEFAVAMLKLGAFQTRDSHSGKR